MSEAYLNLNDLDDLLGVLNKHNPGFEFSYIEDFSALIIPDKEFDEAASRLNQRGTIRNWVCFKVTIDKLPGHVISIPIGMLGEDMWSTSDIVSMRSDRAKISTQSGSLYEMVNFLPGTPHPGYQANLIRTLRYWGWHSRGVWLPQVI